MIEPEIFGMGTPGGNFKNTFGNAFQRPQNQPAGFLLKPRTTFQRIHGNKAKPNRVLKAFQSP